MIPANIEENIEIVDWEEEVTSDKDITTFDLVIDWTYEWYKTLLLDLANQRNKLEKKMEKYVTKIKAGTREEKNRNRLKVLYAQIEEITILWFQILQEAYKDFPNEVETDSDLPRGTSNWIDLFQDQRIEAKEKLEKNFDEVMATILPPSK